MTATTAAQDRSFAPEHTEKVAWHRWREDRLATVQAPHGVASAVATVWLGEEPTAIDGLSGRWFSDGVAVLGTGDPGAGADTEGAPWEVRLAAGESVELDGKLVRAVARDGRLAARVLDPQAGTRIALTGIEAFPWQADWRFAGVFEPDAEQLRVDQVDGGSAEFAVAGRVRFSFAGREHELLGFRTDTGLHVSFGDLSNGAETKQFRFLDVLLEDPHDTAQRVIIDFNRAYLPPCSFALAYLCPLPPAGNRLDLAVLAGERRQSYASAGSGA